MNHPILDWIEDAAEMEDEEEIFIPLGDGTYAEMERIFGKACKRYSSVDPATADRLACKAQQGDKQTYFVIYKKPAVPIVAFKRGKDGQLTPLLPTPPGRKRVIRQMQEDGLSFERMKELILDLKVEEL